MFKKFSKHNCADFRYKVPVYKSQINIEYKKLSYEEKG